VRREQTAALVLRRWPYSETSLALHVLTPTQGVVSLLAKGVHRVTSGSFGVLDTWALVELEFGGPDDAEMLNLYGSRLLDRMSGISTGIERLAAAGVVAEIAELAAPPGHPAKEPFLYLLRRLRELDAGAPPRDFLCSAILEGLDLLGLGPVLEIDDEADDGRRTAWFSAAAGGLLAADSARPAGAARRVRTATLEWLRALRADRTALPAADAGIKAAALTILGEFLAYHLERPPRAWTLLRKRLPRHEKAR